MTINPARFYNLEVGHLTEGAKADIVIFDVKQSWIVDKKDFVSKASNSPFIGEKIIWSC
ncbi:amidohydrolase family protein [Lachnobacterium bovis]|uniref:amidohydrolase family protein n=1 Tax=Lachnobacterium bovis TaxID=140626 RepID=UPI000AC6475A|nr:amidohydrolase family protein [Lachnobacterium bovis]